MAEDNRKEVKDLSHFQYLYGGAIAYFSLSFSGPFFCSACLYVWWLRDITSYYIGPSPGRGG
jgi:hypothetical protein